MEILSCQTLFLLLDFHRNCILHNDVNMAFPLYQTYHDRISSVCTEFLMTILLQTDSGSNPCQFENIY